MPSINNILPNLYLYEDTCNVYVITHEDRAVVIDCGSGAVQSLLADIGVRNVDWLLFTHHHRDQCFGATKFVDKRVRLAVPQYERFLFERAADYWQQKRIYDNYNDRNTFFAIGQNLAVAQSLVDYERFDWGPYSFFILPTPGHTQGSITLIADIDHTLVAFTGDLIHQGGKVFQLHALEYEYGDLAGANWVAQSIHALRKRNIEIALPSHGPAIYDLADCIDQLDDRLHRLMALQRDRLGGTDDGRFAHEIKMEGITPHLIWGTADTCSNFYVIKSDSGKALIIDYPYSSAGLFHSALHSPEPFAALRFIEHHLDELQEDWGIKSFDVVIPTHIHDDHVCGIPYLQRHHGTQCWALEDVAKILEAPQQWNTPCLLEAPIRIDRRFKDGDRFEWEGFELEIVFYPGQTEFHSAILAEVDGRRVLFSGDSSYPLKRYLPEKESEWMVNTVLRNSLTLAMHRKCADEFERLHPDLLCPGHGPIGDIPAEAPAAHRRYVQEKEAIWRDLLPEPADLGIDLFWARLVPYQTEIRPGQASQFTLQLRNGFEGEATFTTSLASHVGLSVQPEACRLTLPPGESGSVSFTVAVPSAQHIRPHPHRRHLLTANVTVNGKPYGPISEALVVIPP